MVKKFTCFLFLIAWVCLYSNAQSARTYDVYKTNATIVIDGEVDPVWEMVDTTNCSYFDEGQTIDDEWDFNAYCRMLWDDNTIYFLGIIYDDYMPDSADYVGIDGWHIDNVEIYWDPANAKTDDMANHTQLRFTPTRTPPYYDQWSEGGFNVTDPVTDWNMIITDDGWNLEVAFSLTNMMARIDSTMSEDYQMGWNICNIDNDDPTGENNRKSNLRWTETGGDSWNHGILMGTVTFKSEIISDIKDVTSKAALKVYPNPAKDYIRISDISNVQRIEISNLVGQEVWAVDDPTTNIINIARLPQGVYLIKLYTDKNTVSSFKISKQ